MSGSAPNGTGPPVPVVAPDPSAASFWVWRGDASGGDEKAYLVPVGEGQVVLDAMHWIQQHTDSDLAVRWNCKAAKCGSCSAEINGRPALMCKTRVDALGDGPITVRPMKTFPVIKDLVTDVGWNYRVNKRIQPFTHAATEPVPFVMQQEDVERTIEFRKCIECFLCQDVCHVLREHDEGKDEYFGPRFMIRMASLEMHPKDVGDRVPQATPRVASATATSPSAALRSARSTSTSPTTASSRSRSGWPTAITIRYGRSGAASGGPGLRRRSTDSVARGAGSGRGRRLVADVDHLDAAGQARDQSQRRGGCTEPLSDGPEHRRIGRAVRGSLMDPDAERGTIPFQPRSRRPGVNPDGQTRHLPPGSGRAATPNRAIWRRCDVAGGALPRRRPWSGAR
jgi:succinate dehydrogenase / fumarate reductase iron-sulfur subunit